MISREMNVAAPPGWSLAEYRKKNDELAKKYGEPRTPFDLAIEQARRHLAHAEMRRDSAARIADLHAAIDSLIAAVVSQGERSKP